MLLLLFATLAKAECAWPMITVLSWISSSSEVLYRKHRNCMLISAAISPSDNRQEAEVDGYQVQVALTIGGRCTGTARTPTSYAASRLSAEC